MLSTRTFMRRIAALVFILSVGFTSGPIAADILDDWSSVKPPEKPELKPVTVEPSTTALLLLDLMKTNCGARPRCVATVPTVKKLYDSARSANMLIWYSFVGSNGNATTADQIDPAITARDGEWMRQNGPDKFIGSNLEDKLKTKGVKTVIVCGTSFRAWASAPGAAQRSAATR